MSTNITIAQTESLLPSYSPSPVSLIGNVCYNDTLNYKVKSHDRLLAQLNQLYSQYSEEFHPSDLLTENEYTHIKLIIPDEDSEEIVELCFSTFSSFFEYLRRNAIYANIFLDWNGVASLLDCNSKKRDNIAIISFISPTSKYLGDTEQRIKNHIESGHAKFAVLIANIGQRKFQYETILAKPSLIWFLSHGNKAIFIDDKTKNTRSLTTLLAPLDKLDNSSEFVKNNYNDFLRLYLNLGLHKWFYRYYGPGDNIIESKEKDYYNDDDIFLVNYHFNGKTGSSLDKTIDFCLDVLEYVKFTNDSNDSNNNNNN